MREIGSALYAFMDKYLSWIDKPKIGVTDVIEIIIIAFVLSHMMGMDKIRVHGCFLKELLLF